MSHKVKTSGSEKIATIEKYLRREDSLSHLASLLGVCFQSVKQWLQTYQSLGPNGLLNINKNSSYSSDLKTTAVNDYLAGDGSHMDICCVEFLKIIHFRFHYSPKRFHRAIINTSKIPSTCFVSFLHHQVSL